MDYKILKAQLSTMSHEKKCNGFSLFMFEELNGGIASIEQAEQIVNKYRELSTEQKQNLISREEKIREQAYSENIEAGSQSKNRSAKTSRKVNKKQTTQKKAVIYEVKEESPITESEKQQQPIIQQTIIQQHENLNQEKLQNDQTPITTYDMYSVSNIKQQDSQSQHNIHDLENDKAQDNESRSMETKQILLQDSEDAVDEARNVRTPQLQERLQNQEIQNQIDENLVVKSLNKLQDEGQININESKQKNSRAKRLIKDNDDILDPHIDYSIPMSNFRKSMSKRKQSRQRSNKKNQNELIDN